MTFLECGACINAMMVARNDSWFDVLNDWINGLYYLDLKSKLQPIQLF